MLIKKSIEPQHISYLASDLSIAIRAIKVRRSHSRLLTLYCCFGPRCSQQAHRPDHEVLEHPVRCLPSLAHVVLEAGNLGCRAAFVRPEGTVKG